MQNSKLPYSNAETPQPQTNLRRRQNVAFGVVGGLLLMAALGLNLGVMKMGLVFQKGAVPPAQLVSSIDLTFGDWRQAGKDRRIPHAEEESLNTDLYVFRNYVNYAALTDFEKGQFDRLTDKPEEQFGYAYQLMMMPEPKAVAFSFTYYTGKVDSVPHIPERCFVAGGFDPVDGGSDYPVWSNVLPTGEPLTVRAIDFQQQDSVSPQSATRRNVVYFFSVNGLWKGDVESVRAELQQLGTPETYFAKIELMTMSGDADAAHKAMQDFLRAGLPSIMTVLPIDHFRNPTGSSNAIDDAESETRQTEQSKAETL